MKKGQQPLSRRGFLKIIAAGSAGGAAAAAGWKLLGADHVLSETRLLMGTVVNLTLVTEDRKQGKTVIDSTFQTMKALETIFSRFQTDSQVSVLNTDGELINPNPLLIDILQKTQKLSRQTGGAFDITVKPLLDYYRGSGSRQAHITESSDITPLLELVNFQAIEISRERIHFQERGMEITLDGIAKGYVVDCGVQVLKDVGFSNVLVEAGGDLFASGTRSGGSSWQVGVRSPRGESLEVKFRLPVQNCAVATSGDYLQPFTEDFQLHHILDPRSGVSQPDLASATVLAPEAWQADALATTVMVLGLDQGLDYLESQEGCEGLLISKDGNPIPTPGLSI